MSILGEMLTHFRCLWNEGGKRLHCSEGGPKTLSMSPVSPDSSKTSFAPCLKDEPFPLSYRVAGDDADDK